MATLSVLFYGRLTVWLIDRAELQEIYLQCFDIAKQNLTRCLYLIITKRPAQAHLARSSIYTRMHFSPRISKVT